MVFRKGVSWKTTKKIRSSPLIRLLPAPPSRKLRHHRRRRGRDRPLPCDGSAPAGGICHRSALPFPDGGRGGAGPLCPAARRRPAAAGAGGAVRPVDGCLRFYGRSAGSQACRQLLHPLHLGGRAGHRPAGRDSDGGKVLHNNVAVDKHDKIDMAYSNYNGVVIE